MDFLLSNSPTTASFRVCYIRSKHFSVDFYDRQWLDNKRRLQIKVGCVYLRHNRHLKPETGAILVIYLIRKAVKLN
jgi:hypothetical protein